MPDLEVVELRCSFCYGEVVRDAEAELLIDPMGNPACSHICQEALNRRIADEAERQIAIAAAWDRYISLDLQESEHAAFYEDYNRALNRLVDMVGAGSHTEDITGTVYEIEKVTGAWVRFQPYRIARTRRPGEPEEAGTLPIERAKELGYDPPPLPSDIPF